MHDLSIMPTNAVDSRRRNITFLGAALAASGLISKPALAQAKNYATMLVPFPVGGAGDFLARLLAEKLPPILGRNVVVDNKPGGATRIAGDALKNGPNDGNLVLVSPVDPMFIVPAIFSTAKDYNPAKDFKPISDLALVQFGIAVPANSPYRTLAQYIESARTQSSQGNIGISVIGSLLHFLAMEFVKQTAIPGVLVPYRGGAPMVTDLIGGQLPAAMDATTSFMEFHRTGKIRVLAVSGARRAESLPEIPTFAESGFPSLTATSRYAVYARADMPVDKMMAWNKALRQVLSDEDLKAKLQKAGYDTVPGSTPDAAAAIVNEMAQRWLPVIRRSGFKAD